MTTPSPRPPTSTTLAVLWLSLAVSSGCGGPAESGGEQAFDDGDLAAEHSASEALAPTSLPVPPGISPDDPLVLKGYLDAALYHRPRRPVDPTGRLDSTAGLQQALDDAYTYGLALYLRRGTYRISNTLTARQAAGPGAACAEAIPGGSGAGRYNTPHDMARAPVLVGQAGANPVLVLTDRLPAYAATAPDLKPVISFRNVERGSACAFNMNVRGIDLVLGANPKAFGIDMPAAQSSTIEDVRVDATGAYAGIIGTPARGNSGIDVEVIGGEYGLISTEDRGIAFQGLTLRGQRRASFRLEGGESLAITGFRFAPASTGKAVELVGSGKGLVLVDGTIELPPDSTAPRAIDNAGRSNMFLGNVYLKSSVELLAEGPGGRPLAGSATWTRVLQYVYSPTTPTTLSLEDGVLSSAAVRLSVAPETTSPPAQLVRLHSLQRSPSFETVAVVDARVAGAKGDGVTDDTRALQAAIDTGRPVFLPRGDYRLTAPLVLPRDAQLFGVPGMRSRLFPAWNASATTFAVDTELDVQGISRAYLGDVLIFLPAGSLAETHIGGVSWRLGGTATLHQVATDSVRGKEVAAARQALRVSGGHSGGRFHGFRASKSFGKNAGSRGLLITGASGPATFYGMNIEHGGGDYNVELTRTTHARFFGLKTETQFLEGEPIRPFARVQDSSNIFFGGFVGLYVGGGVNDALQFVRSDRVLAAVIHTTRGGKVDPPGDLIVEELGGRRVAVPGEADCGLYRRGTFEPGRF